MTSPRQRLIVALVIGLCGGIAIASPALAHIDPDPTEAQAGSQLSVGFTVEHGCAGSPTVQLDMRLPDGATNPVPEPPDGWTGSVDGNVVTFAGGPLPTDQAMTFNVSMVLPPTPDTTVYFPFVQRCESGTIRWIDIPSDGSGTDSDEPAPAMQLVGPVATPTTAATTTPPTTNAPSTTADTTSQPATTTTVAAPTTTTGPPPTTTSASAPSTQSPTSTPAPTDADGEHGDGSTPATVVFIGVVIAVVAGATALVIRARRRGE